MSEECQELKNIKYQTMLLNSNSKIVSTKKNSENLDDFLQKEKAQNKSKPWSKLGRSTKLKKLDEFVTQFAIEKEITDIEKKSAGYEAGLKIGDVILEVNERMVNSRDDILMIIDESLLKVGDDVLLKLWVNNEIVFKKLRLAERK